MEDEDLPPRWLATCHYNGAATGSGRSVTLVVKTNDPTHAAREAWMEAMRRDKQSICITGLSAIEIPRDAATNPTGDARERPLVDVASPGDDADGLYLIWSEEHGAWWNPHRAGYTDSMIRAGRYSLAEAASISNSANGHGRFCEVPVPLTGAMKLACDMPSGGR